jgi:hypothetical protein
MESKAIVARNAYKGAERPKMRELMKLLRRELKNQRGYLETIIEDGVVTIDDCGRPLGFHV